ncbi:MAG: L,D-transpeptidase [Clostridia bacterium]|nr:L,D-transpeptidase [Clostridia bacterium]
MFRRWTAALMALCLMLTMAFAEDWLGEWDDEEELDFVEDELFLGEEEPLYEEPDDPWDQAETVQRTPAAASGSAFTPAHTSPYEGLDTTFNYWTMPMDITDEEAVWEMLMQPMTVLDNGKKNAQKAQVTLHAQPSLDSAGVGVVTMVSQGVHVLETLDNGWSLIECYSSSFHDSDVKAWNMLVQGYVETKYLKTVSPDTSMGIVIDKLTQRLYIFREGHLFSTLLVSTGLTNAKQPYNETRSGEFFMLLPAVGGFADGKMVCSMAIRFNSGDLLHEVPHNVNADGTNNYSTFDPKLGTRASHGCIRVQHNKTPEGANMKWIWDHRKNNVKLVIWEDWQGRQIPYPEDDTVVYYNPNKGKMYHSSEHCYSASKVTFTPFTYGELDTGEFASLTRCTYCNPPLRKSEIDAINEEHAPGGDHDPILTEARHKQGF